MRSLCEGGVYFKIGRDKEIFSFNLTVYRKISIISPGLIFVQKDVLLGLFSGELIFGGAYLLLEGILRFKMGWA